MKKFLTSVLLFSFCFCLFAERPLVRNIQAAAGKGKKINIFWTLPNEPDKPITQLFVYRDTKPISSFDIVEKLDPIARLEPDVTGYTDTVSDYKVYYYAVVTVTDKPYDLILVSINATNEGVKLPVPKQKEPEKLPEYEKLYPEGKIRETPLPYIDLIEDLNEKSTISDSIAISTKALSAEKKVSTPLMTIYIFEEDLVSPDGGDDYLLFEILKTYFVQKKYQKAINQIRKLEGTNISEQTRARANFYIGEAQYLLGNYNEAVKSFVKVQEYFPDLTQKWVDSALDRI